MTLSVQISTLLFSFVFGFLFAFLISINYRFIYHSNKVIQVLFTFAFVLLSTLIYFIILEKLNYGALHIYYCIMIILGFIVEHGVEKLRKQ